MDAKRGARFPRLLNVKRGTSGQRTNAGRCFVALRSAKGKGTRTTSPWLKLVVDGILGIVPELKCGLCRFEPTDIVRLNFQMRRQIMKQSYLVVHIQVLDCFADCLNRAHRRNLIEAISDGKLLLEWSGVRCQISDYDLP